MAALLKLTLQVEGMTCASCSGRVEKALRAVPGVQAVTVNLATGQAHVTGVAASVAALSAAAERAGYTAAEVLPNAPVQRSQDPGWPVLLAAVLSVPLVLPMLGAVIGQHWMQPPWLCFRAWRWFLASPGRCR